MQFQILFALLSMFLLGTCSSRALGTTTNGDVKKQRPDQGPDISGVGPGFFGPGGVRDVGEITPDYAANTEGDVKKERPESPDISGVGPGFFGPSRVRDLGEMKPDYAVTVDGDIKKERPQSPDISGFGPGHFGPALFVDEEENKAEDTDPEDTLYALSLDNNGLARRDAGTPIATVADGVNINSTGSGLTIHDVDSIDKSSNLVLTFSPLLTGVLCSDTFSIVIEVKQGSSSGVFGQISTALGGQGTATPLNVTFVCGSSSPQLSDPGENIDLIVFVPANVVLNSADNTDTQNIASTIELIDLNNNEEYTASVNLQAWVQNSSPNPPITFLGLAQP